MLFAWGGSQDPSSTFVFFPFIGPCFEPCFFLPAMPLFFLARWHLNSDYPWKSSASMYHSYLQQWEEVHNLTCIYTATTAKGDKKVAGLNKGQFSVGVLFENWVCCYTDQSYPLGEMTAVHKWRGSSMKVITSNTPLSLPFIALEWIKTLWKDAM